MPRLTCAIRPVRNASPARGIDLAVEIADVSKLDVEPGELPEKMAAWVIRQEREGEPKDAMRVEEIDVPSPAPSR